MKKQIFSPTYDLIVLGAGPAGLSAARTAARLGLKTLILEKQPRLEALNQPALAALDTVPGLITGRICHNGLLYPELELLISSLFLKGTYSRKRYLSPAGLKLPSLAPTHHTFPTAVINLTELRQHLAGQACLAGAELRLDTPVVELVQVGRQVVAVRTAAGSIRTRLVIAAAGNSAGHATLNQETPLPADNWHAARHAFTVSQQMTAPAARSEDVGQILTFGRRYSSAPRVVGQVIVPQPGQVVVSLTMFTDEPRRYAGDSLWLYLNEYVDEDPRVCHLFQGATITDRSGGRLAYYGPPPQVTAGGFLAAGDAVSPWGYLGILPSIYLGQRAARLAAEAIAAGDTSAGRLAAYDRLYVRPLLRLLQEEQEQLLALAGLDDESLDRLAYHAREFHAASPLAAAVPSFATV